MKNFYPICFSCVLIMLYKHALIKVGINQVKKAKTIFHFKNMTLHANETWLILFITIACKKVIHAMFAVVTPAIHPI